jgi:virginiamycin B lyase
VWFTERGTATRPGNKIGRVVLTPGNDPVVEEFPLPETIPPELAPVLPLATPAFGRRPLGITAGPDGAMWFAQERMNQIGRIDPYTLEISEYPLPNLAFRRQPFEITAGPDGHIWFTEAFGNRIGRISTAGDIVEFPVPTSASGPNTIRRGPDPNAAKDCAQQRAAGAFSAYANFGDCVSRHATTRTLWFTEFNANRVAKITTDGVIREYPIPTSNSRPIGITQGPDGAVWFAENGGNKIGRLTVKRVGSR